MGPDLREAASSNRFTEVEEDEEDEDVSPSLAATKKKWMPVVRDSSQSLEAHGQASSSTGSSANGNDAPLPHDVAANPPPPPPPPPPATLLAQIPFAAPDFAGIDETIEIPHSSGSLRNSGCSISRSQSSCNLTYGTPGLLAPPADSTMTQDPLPPVAQGKDEAATHVLSPSNLSLRVQEESNRSLPRIELEKPTPVEEGKWVKVAPLQLKGIMEPSHSIPSDERAHLHSSRSLSPREMKAAQRGMRSLVLCSCY